MTIAGGDSDDDPSSTTLAELRALRSHPAYHKLAEIERQIVDDLIDAGQARHRCGGCRHLLAALKRRLEIVATQR